MEFEGGRRLGAYHLAWTTAMQEEHQDRTSREPPARPGDRTLREAEFTRRALLEAGWTAPVVLAVTLPATAYAQSGHADHGDGPHADHGDHSDSSGSGGPPPFPEAVHTDHFDHTDHADHADAHLDVHGDVGHVDQWTTTHEDAPFDDIFLPLKPRRSGG